MRVLIAEDEIAVVRLLKVLMERRGYETMIAGDGSQALRTAQETHPDLIVMGAVMAEMGGCEVLTELRSDPATADIPVLMVSTEERVQLPDWRKVEHVPKPFPLPVLDAAVERLLNDNGRAA